MNIHNLLKERAPKETQALNDYLKENRLAVFLVSKKLAGKGVYSKYLTQVTNDAFVHISIGDIVRATRVMLLETDGKEKLIRKLEGREIKSLQFDDIVDLIVDHSNKKLIPTELVIALFEAEVEEQGERSILIDGFPRTMEQIAGTKQIVAKFAKQGIRSLFLIVECPEEVLRFRMEGRRVCPECANSRNIELQLTDTVGYDPESKEFYLVCDNPSCKAIKMIQKKGDDEGFDSVIERNKLTSDLMTSIKKQFRGDMVIVSNAVTVSEAKRHDKADFTERAFLKWDSKHNKVIKEFGSLVITDDDGKTKALSRNAEPVVVDIVRGMVKWLRKNKLIAFS